MVQYKTTVKWDPTLCALEFIEDDAITRHAGIAGLCQFAIMIVSGVPANTPGRFIPAAQIQNAIDGTWYENTGSVNAPNFSLVPSSGSGMTGLTQDVLAGPGTGNQAATVVAWQNQALQLGPWDVGAIPFWDNAGNVLNTTGNTSGSTSTPGDNAYVFGANRFTSTGGGGAVESYPIANCTNKGDLPFVQLRFPGSNTVSVVSANIVTPGLVQVTYSADPGNDAQIYISVERRIDAIL